MDSATTPGLVLDSRLILINLHTGDFPAYLSLLQTDTTLEF